MSEPVTLLEHVFDLPENEITLGTTDSDPGRPFFLQVKGQHAGQFFRYQRMSLRDALDLASAIVQIVANSPPCCSFCGTREPRAFWAAPNEAARICDACTRDALLAISEALYSPGSREAAT